MFAWRNIHLDQPFFGQVAAVGGGILTNVAGDIGELKGEAKIAGAVERGAVIGRHAHQHRHHAADRAGDMIAIAHHDRPRERGRHSARVEREALDHVPYEACGIAHSHDDAQRVERWIARPSPRKAASVSTRIVDSRACGSAPTSSCPHDPAHRRYRRTCGTRHRAARRVRGFRGRTASTPSAKLLTHARSFPGVLTIASGPRGHRVRGSTPSCARSFRSADRRPSCRAADRDQRRRSGYPGAAGG
jgi:hypothetical protein